MQTGDWVITQNHGAYHNELSNNFNGFDFPQKLYIHD
jgi:diaminopimelate decarboxylase